MFRRALTTLRITSIKNNEISSLEASFVDECIAELTNKIFELEDRKKKLRQYLYIVGHEIKRHLPPPTSEKSRQLSSFPCDLSASIKLFGDVEFVRTCVEELLKSCTPNSPPREIPQKNRRDSVTQCPSSMTERPEILAADRTISPPTSLNRKYLLFMTARTPDRILRLNRMVFKKTELEVEVDKLQSDSKFWGSVCGQVEEFFLSPLNREIESNQSRPGIKQRPTLIRRNANRTAETVAIQKKNVPVRTMLERMTSDHTSQVGQSSKAMKDDSGVQEICNGSSNEEKKPRNDSGAGMEPEVEIAQQHFVNTSYDVDLLLANACI